MTDSHVFLKYCFQTNMLPSGKVPWSS